MTRRNRSRWKWPSLTKIDKVGKKARWLKWDEINDVIRIRELVFFQWQLVSNMSSETKLIVVGNLWV